MARTFLIFLLISLFIFNVLCFDIGMKILVVTTDGTQPSFAALVTALNARGIPYDVHRTLVRGVFTGRREATFS